MPTKITVEKLYKIFGDHPNRVFPLLEKGASKDEIYKETGQAVGLADVSFEVAEGEILVVMGLSGSGKSTLIRCVNRLIEPTRGKVTIDGHDITKVGHKELLDIRRKKFGMVFQNFALFPHRSVLSNTEYGLEVQGINSEERSAAARDALKLVGLDGWEDALPRHLSGGMQQRVGLARALAVDPDILLMDEAFSALDPLIRRDMQHELIGLQARLKKTIMFITHDLDEALKIGCRIVLMKDGKVVQVGTPEEILTNPATRYVEKFVEDVDMSKVLTAESVMVKTRVVGFPADGPRTILHKMKEEGISSIFVVKSDYRLIGYVTAEQASEAIKRGDKTIEPMIQPVPEVVHPDEQVNQMFPIMAETRLPVPVVNEENKILGVVVKGSLLAGLAEGGIEQ